MQLDLTPHTKEIVQGYIKDKFPEKYAEYQQFRKNREFEEEEFQALLDEVYSEDSSLDRNDPSGVDQEKARMKAEEKIRLAIAKQQIEGGLFKGRLLGVN